MAKAKTGSQITEARLRQAELVACARTSKVPSKIGQIRVLLADIEHIVDRASAAHNARVKFEKGRV